MKRETTVTDDQPSSELAQRRWTLIDHILANGPDMDRAELLQLLDSIILDAYREGFDDGHSRGRGES